MSERLDRGLCDIDWRNLFPEACIKHLAYSQSDHCPILLQLAAGGGRSLGERPFKFHTSWLLHRDFPNLMESAWKWEGSLNQTLKEFQLKLEAWNRDTFGKIFQRKRRNVLRLLGVQRALERRITEGLLKLDSKLRLERREILLQEELLWKQKSRVDWLKAGESNTRFFPHLHFSETKTK